MIKFFDLEEARASAQADIAAAVNRVVRSGFYILGPELERFENAFAGVCGARYAIGVANGLDALILALRAAGVGPDDEVIVSGHTFFASWLAILALRALPVPVDARNDTLEMDTDRLEAAITPRTKAIVPVHLYGQPVNKTAVTQIAHANRIPVIDDCAQAHMARWADRPLTAGSLACAYSFYPTKNLGALGDGGAIATDDEGLASKLRELRNYGSTQKYRHQVIGYNSRLDEVHAAVLYAQLQHLPQWTERRCELAAKYRLKLASLAPLVRVQEIDTRASPVWHLFVIRTTRRDALQAFLSSQDIQTQIHYPIPCSHQKAVDHIAHTLPCLPVSEAVAGELLSLPLWPGMTDVQVNTVCDAITRFAEESSE